MRIPGTNVMNIIQVILISACTIGLAARAELPAGWGTNYTNTVADSAARKLPVLVYFTASWCGPCKLMGRLTFTNTAVMEALSGIPHVAVDIDEEPNPASSHDVSAVPTFVLLSATGEEVQRSTGFQPPDEFLQWLTNSIVEAREIAIKRAVLKDKLANVDQWLSSTHSRNASEVAATLFELCASRDQDILKAAATQLHILASRDPTIVLAGINDPRLATRIQVANVLRARLGELFDIDVWTDKASRAEAAENLREKLITTRELEKTP